jgi:hypothetical protein
MTKSPIIQGSEEYWRILDRWWKSGYSVLPQDKRTESERQEEQQEMVDLIACKLTHDGERIEVYELLYFGYNRPEMQTMTVSSGPITMELVT